jgi:hypothetical protein
MMNDVHYIAEKYIRELIESGIWMDPAVQTKIPKPINPVPLDGFILLRGRTYFYGHHPKTQEPKWTYDVNLAQVLTNTDADEIMNLLMSPGHSIAKLPAPTQKERAL